MVDDQELAQTVDELAYASMRLLGHEHNWVRCNAAKMLTQILAHYDYVYVGQQLVGIKREQAGDEKALEFIYAHPAQDLKSLVLDLCAQVTAGETAQEMIDELVKLLLYVAHMLRDVPFNLKQEPDNDSKSQPSTGKVNLHWLVRNIRTLINKEVTKAPHDTSIVSCNCCIRDSALTVNFFLAHSHVHAHRRSDYIAQCGRSDSSGADFTAVTCA